MANLFRRWLDRHISFNTYLKIAKPLEALEQKIDLITYVSYTRTREGACLRGTVSPEVHHVISGIIFKALPYALVLAATIFVPPFLPQPFSKVMGQPDMSAISGFVTAVLAIAGIFLTLFYTNVTTVFSTKYPSSNGDIPKLFVSLVSSDATLSFCTSFTIVASLSFVACAAQRFNWLSFAYVILLTLILIGGFSRIFALGAGRTDMTAVSAIPAKRFLALAKAASFDKRLYNSDTLIRNFKRMANTNVALLDDLMDYSLSAGDYSQSYSKAVNEVILKTLVTYSRTSTLIDIDSCWHTEIYNHRTWFMSPSYELNLAISTGTIPLPERKIDRFGHHRNLHRISDKYGKRLVEGKNLAEYSSYFEICSLSIEHFMKSGDIAWAIEYLDDLLPQCLELCLSVDAEDKDSLQAKCHLLEQYAAAVIAIPLELTKLCDNVPVEAFHYLSFDNFSQEELQKRGFPLGEDTKMKDLCKKLQYEKNVFPDVETPKWWFDEQVNVIGSEVIGQLCSQISLQHNKYCSTTKELVTSDPKSCYTLALKETELFRKSSNCIYKLSKLAQTHFDAKNIDENYIGDLRASHDMLVRTYPALTKAFMRDNAKFEDFFPDLYGFAFFNYCRQLLEDILNNRLPTFCSSIDSLYHLSIISSMNLQEKIPEGSSPDIYRAQVLLEPTIFFLELCGMAYAMAELCGDNVSQSIMTSHIDSLISKNSRVHDRWKACIELDADTGFSNKISMDLFTWRRDFLNAVDESGKYPDIPRYPFFATDRQVPNGKERLLKMIPSEAFDFNNFSGCRVFRYYLLGSDGHDRQN